MAIAPTVLHATSRLRWLDGSPHPAHPDAIEIPHVRGHPVDDAVPGDTVRVREWPNRLGIRESLRDDDTVAWYPELATRPDRGTIVRVDLTVDRTGALPGDHAARGPAGLDDHDIDVRTRWLRSLVHRIEQSPGHRSAAPIVSPCGIVLTPGRTAARAAELTSWGSALEPCARRLGEFPGGIQLAITEAAWLRRDAYAAAVTAIIDQQG